MKCLDCMDSIRKFSCESCGKTDVCSDAELAETIRYNAEERRAWDIYAANYRPDAESFGQAVDWCCDFANAMLERRRKLFGGWK